MPVHRATFAMLSNQENPLIQQMQDCIIPQVLTYIEEGVRKESVRCLEHTMVDRVIARGAIDS